MSEWCRQCGESGNKAEEIVHDLDCPTWAEDQDGDVYDWADEIDELYDALPVVNRHADCTHLRRGNSDYRCELRQRKAQAANRALGGL